MGLTLLMVKIGIKLEYNRRNDQEHMGAKATLGGRGIHFFSSVDQRPILGVCESLFETIPKPHAAKYTAPQNGSDVT